MSRKARALDIYRRTATRWVKASRLNGNKVPREERHGRRKGDAHAGKEAALHDSGRYVLRTWVTKQYQDIGNTQFQDMGYTFEEWRGIM